MAIASATAVAGPVHISSQTEIREWRLRLCADTWAAVVHCSMFFFEISVRQSVAPMA